MEIKTETKLVPVTVNRKVKSTTFVLTEAEAKLVRDVLGGGDPFDLADNAAAGLNYSKFTKHQFRHEIVTLLGSLNNSLPPTALAPKTGWLAARI